MAPTLFSNISQLLQPHAREGSTRSPVDLARDAALLVHDGAVAAAGPRAEVERLAAAAERVDLGGRAVVPGLVDSHTHVLFAGDRMDELSRRARGESYAEIARAGGGIVRSMEPLRAASVEELARGALRRVVRMLGHGTTTIEAKSGYGLSVEAELKSLRAIARLAELTAVSISPTVLAHVVPPEARSARAEYVRRFCAEVVIPAAREGLARSCDVFVESGAFSAGEAREISAAAVSAGLSLKLHVDQLEDGNGAALAAELGALSADHLEHTSAAGRAALAGAGVVATILPGCALFLGKGPWPDGRALRDAGCDVAVATDANPGSSMILDVALCATMAATRCGLSLEEALWAVTRGGARALGLEDRGRLVAGERADFVVVDHTDWRALLYNPGDAPVAAVFVAGEKVVGR